MRYLLNLPLLAVFAALFGLFNALVLREGRGGQETAFMVVLGIATVWLMLAVVLVACGAMGALRWPQVQGGSGFMVGLLACGALLLLSLLPIGMALESNEAAARWGYGQTLPRLVALGLPLVLALYGVWMVDAPAGTREAPAAHLAALAIIAAFCLGAAVVSVRELARWDRVAQQAAVARAAEEDEHAAAQRRELAALGESDPLFSWYPYTNDNVPKDVQAEALRRIAGRPKLEAELTEVLASGNPSWSEEGFALIVKLPFTPSSALAQPMRDAIAALAGRLESESKEPSDQGDKRLDYYRSYALGMAVRAAERLAEGAGVDLGASIDALARAVALYPTADTARSFPARVAETKRRIAASLASRHG